MKSISFWAKENPRKAQISIVFLYILLNLLAISAGLLLYDSGIRLSESLINSSFLLFLIATILYKKQASYFYRKSLDLVLITTTFLMLTFWGNNISEPTFYLPLSPKTANGVTIKNSGHSISVNKIENEKTNIKKKEWRKQIKENLKKYKLKISPGAKALLIILVVVAACFATYLLGALACNISCSGAEGLAVVVLVGGLITILGGGFLLIRRILKSHAGKKNVEFEEPSSM